MGIDDPEEDSREGEHVGAAGVSEGMLDGDEERQAGDGEGEDLEHDASSAAVVLRGEAGGRKSRGKGSSGQGAPKMRIPDDMAPIVPFLRRRRHAWEGTNSSRVVVQSGKRKGLLLYTDAAGRIVEKNADMGFAIGRPSNAGVCHLKNKQVCRQVCADVSRCAARVTCARPLLAREGEGIHKAHP